MIRYEEHGEVAWITIDRPEKTNAITNDGWAQLIDSLDRAEADARVAILRGAGDAFSAGDDIATIAELETADDVETLTDGIYGGLFGVEALEIPVIAAIDGLAYGGGFELVAAADLAIATERSTFAIPETRIGAYPPYVMSRIGAIGGKKRLMELALTGASIDAEQALEWGLLNDVVPAGALEDSVGDYVDDIVESPRRAISLAKRNAHVGMAATGERQQVRGGFSQVANDPDCQARAQAFLDK